MATGYDYETTQDIGTSNTTVYTTPTVLSAHIDKAKVFNYGSATATLTGYLVRSGDTATADNRDILVIVPVGKSVTLYEIMGDLLKTGDLLVFSSSAASALSVRVKVREITS